MRIPLPLQLLAPFCILSAGLVFSGLFDNVYSSDASISSKKLDDTQGNVWTYMVLFLAGACFYRVLDGWRIASQRKITAIDVYFISVLSGLALLQMVSHYFLFSSFFDPTANSTFISRMTALSDWCILPFFGWNVAWSRHVRRGWTPRHNWMACVIPSLCFFFSLIHRSSYYLFLGLSVVFSCIAIYETYKIHFYRNQIQPLFFGLLVLHFIFFVTRTLDFVFTDFGWMWSYWHVTSFALITPLTNRSYLRILIEVNEHKH